MGSESHRARGRRGRKQRHSFQGWRWGRRRGSGKAGFSPAWAPSEPRCAGCEQAFPPAPGRLHASPGASAEGSTGVGGCRTEPVPEGEPRGPKDHLARRQVLYQKQTPLSRQKPTLVQSRPRTLRCYGNLERLGLLHISRILSFSAVVPPRTCCPAVCNFPDAAEPRETEGSPGEPPRPAAALAAPPPRG